MTSDSATEPPPGVLVVDDEPSIRTLLKRFLIREGFAVWAAADGDEALDVYGRQRQDIHLVLLDVRMPGRDGPETLEALRRLNPDVRCCFISGSTAPYTAEELLRRGALDVIAKPFTLADLAPRLRRLLGRPAGVKGGGP